MVNLPVLLHVNFSLRIESIVYLMTFGDGLSRFVTHRLGISNTNWHRFPTKDHLHEQNRSGSKSFLTFGRNFVKRLAAFLSLRCHDRDHTAMSRDASWLIGRAKALPYWAEGHQELHVNMLRPMPCAAFLHLRVEAQKNEIARTCGWQIIRLQQMSKGRTVFCLTQSKFPLKVADMSYHLHQWCQLLKSSTQTLVRLTKRILHDWQCHGRPGAPLWPSPPGCLVRLLSLVFLPFFCLQKVVNLVSYLCLVFTFSRRLLCRSAGTTWNRKGRLKRWRETRLEKTRQPEWKRTEGSFIHCDADCPKLCGPPRHFVLKCSLANFDVLVQTARHQIDTTRTSQFVRSVEAC